MCWARSEFMKLEIWSCGGHGLGHSGVEMRKSDNRSVGSLVAEHRISLGCDMTVAVRTLWRTPISAAILHTRPRSKWHRSTQYDLLSFLNRTSSVGDVAKLLILHFNCSTFQHLVIEMIHCSCLANVQVQRLHCCNSKELKLALPYPCLHKRHHTHATYHGAYSQILELEALVMK
jgi:hypothetical protein